MPKAQASHIELMKSAVALASKRSFDHLLYVGDLLLPEDVFRGKASARKKLVQAVVSEAQRAVVEASGVRVISLPQYDLGRAEKLKLAIVSGIARGIYAEGDVVVALLSARPVGKPDSILVVNVGPDDEDVGFGFLRTEGVSAEILESLINLGGHHRGGGLGGATGGRALRDRRLEQGDGAVAAAQSQPFPGLLGGRAQHAES